jgi:hypothetical protein
VRDESDAYPGASTKQVQPVPSAADPASISGGHLMGSVQRVVSWGVVYGVGGAQGVLQAVWFGSYVLCHCPLGWLA